MIGTLVPKIICTCLLNLKQASCGKKLPDSLKKIVSIPAFKDKLVFLVQ